MKDKKMFSIYRRIKEIKPTNSIGIEELNLILKSDEMKRKIEAIRKAEDKVTKNQLKGELPLVTFSGEFKERRNTGLIRHSGYISLDIDHISDAKELKERLQKEVPFIHCMFISPSGNGLKIVVETQATNEEEHFKYFKGLEYYFKTLEVLIDTKCKDIGRGCFLSYDENPFYNPQSPILGLEWLEKYSFSELDNRKIVKKGLKRETPICEFVLENKNEVIQKAINRFLKAPIGERHGVLLKQANHLGYYINAKKLDYDECYQGLVSAVQKRKETEVDINLEKDKKTIEDGLIHGIEHPKTVDNLSISTIDYPFWFSYQRKISIKITSFYKFLNRNGFWGFNYGKKKKLVQIEKNIIKIVDKTTIIDFIMEYIKKQPYDIGNGCTNYQLEEAFRNRMNHLLSENQLIAINVFDKEILKDTKEIAHLFFENVVLQITKENTKLLNYQDVKGLIWESSIIERKWNLEEVDEEKYLKSDFLNFVKAVTGERDDKEWSRFESMKSIIGYLLHNYKKPEHNKAVIFLDEIISNYPEGGTGKSILIKALGYYRKSVIIDGKNFKFGRAFDFQSVDVDTKLLVFEDVKKYFNFEQLFSVITDGITVERKGEQPFRINVEDSPKILISSNYTILGLGNSNQRRRIEIEFSQFYNKNHTPWDDFKKTLFDDWTAEDWFYFDRFMVECLHLYLEKGLLTPTIKNLNLKKLQEKTSKEFAKFSETNLSDLKFKKEHNNNELFNTFKELYPTNSFVSQTEFNRWLRIYAEIMELKIIERTSNNKPLFSFQK